MTATAPIDSSRSLAPLTTAFIRFHLSALSLSRYPRIINAGHFTRILALKLNAKAGGVNHFVSRSKPEDSNHKSINEDNMMIAAYDVCHPTGTGRPGSAVSHLSHPAQKSSEADLDPTPSFVGLVASVDQHLNQWPAVAWKNPPGQELLLSSDLEQHFRSRFHHWMDKITTANCRGLLLSTVMVCPRDSIRMFSTQR